MLAICIVCIVGVMIFSNGRWHKLSSETGNWYEGEYASWATKPNMQVLMESCTVPPEPFRRQTLLSFKTTVVLAVLLLVWRFAFTPDSLLYFLAASYCMPLWMVRFFSGYNYVNKCAQRARERWARENSTSSRE